MDASTTPPRPNTQTRLSASESSDVSVCERRPSSSDRDDSSELARARSRSLALLEVERAKMTLKPYVLPASAAARATRRIVSNLTRTFRQARSRFIRRSSRRRARFRSTALRAACEACAASERHRRRGCCRELAPDRARRPWTRSVVCCTASPGLVSSRASTLNSVGVSAVRASHVGDRVGDRVEPQRGPSPSGHSVEGTRRSNASTRTTSSASAKGLVR